MTAILDRIDQAISVTEISRHSRDVLDKLKAGQDKFVIMRNNAPEAVLLPVERYEAMLDELEDLRIEAVARERLSSFERDTAITLDEMTNRLADDE